MWRGEHGHEKPRSLKRIEWSEIQNTSIVLNHSKIKCYLDQSLESQPPSSNQTMHSDRGDSKVSLNKLLSDNEQTFQGTIGTIRFTTGGISAAYAGQSTPCNRPTDRHWSLHRHNSRDSPRTETGQNEARSVKSVVPHAVFRCLAVCHTMCRHCYPLSEGCVFVYRIEILFTFCWESIKPYSLYEGILLILLLDSGNLVLCIDIFGLPLVGNLNLFDLHVE